MSDWVLITGASSGIGRELAKVFARNRFNLVLLARSESRLTGLADELRSGHGIETRVLVMDLARPEAARQTFASLCDLPISILVNNAGLGLYGRFVENDLNAQREIMQVNMDALVELTYLFLKPMLARRQGRILNVASTAAFQPGPMISVYYASKAFVYSFSYALAEESRGSGVTVTTLCPGTTHTEFFARGGFGPVRAPFSMQAGEVAEVGYRALMRGRPVAIAGLVNRLASSLAKRLPTPLTMAIVRKIHSKI